MRKYSWSDADLLGVIACGFTGLNEDWKRRLDAGMIGAAFPVAGGKRFTLMFRAEGECEAQFYARAGAEHAIAFLSKEWIKHTDEYYRLREVEKTSKRELAKLRKQLAASERDTDAAMELAVAVLEDRASPEQADRIARISRATQLLAIVEQLDRLAQRMDALEATSSKGSEDGDRKTG
jgi:hypothetical protein